MPDWLIGCLLILAWVVIVRIAIALQGKRQAGAGTSERRAREKEARAALGTWSCRRIAALDRLKAAGLDVDWRYRELFDLSPSLKAKLRELQQAAGLS